MPDFNTVTFSPQQYAWDYDSYDKATARLCNALKLVGADKLPTTRPIPLMFASPERAWGKMRSKFSKQIAEDREFRIPLPFLSVQQIGDATFDNQRYLYRRSLYRRVGIDTDNYSDSYSHPKPLPYTFQYSIELWTKTRYEARVAVAQWAALWGDGGMTYRLVDHGYPMGVKYVPFFLEGIADNTNLEPVDQQRSLRWTFSLRVEGWLPPTLINQKLVHRINTTIETPESLCEENVYEDNELEAYFPLVEGNPLTGEVVEGDDSFSDPYLGTDYRVSRFASNNPCLEL